MSSHPRPINPLDAYLALEETSEHKHEFMDGQILAMTGASPAHNLITAMLVTALVQQTRGRCKVYPNDMRVKSLRPTPAYTYPDVVVVCGKPAYDEDEQPPSLLNPTLIIEVLSPSTELYDRTRKLARYQQIQSLQEYVLVAQEAPRIESYLRQADGRWGHVVVEGLDATLELPSIACTLALAEVYDPIEFEEEDEA